MTKKPVALSEFSTPDPFPLDAERDAIIEDLTALRNRQYHNLSEGYSAIDAAIARVASRLTNPRAEDDPNE